MKAKEIIFTAEVSKLQFGNKFEHAENSNEFNHNQSAHIH
jgi:hypothetical protein